MARVKIVLNMNSGFPKKTALTVLTFLVLVAVPELLPALKNYRSLDFGRIGSLLDLPLPKPTEVAEAVAAAALRPAGANAKNAASHPTGAGAKIFLSPGEFTNPKQLLDPSGEMDKFYSSLGALSGGQSQGVHILHYGDSPTTADLITADARSLFQRQFGDGGLGFVLVAKPWAWYNHRGIDMSASADWTIDIGGLSQIRDGRNGLGGVSFVGRNGASAKWKLRDRSHTRAEIAYLSQPDGGEFSLEADGKMIGTASTAGETGSPGFSQFDIPEGAREFALKVTRGPVRLYGVDFRKGAAGVVYASLGVNGANITLLSKTFDQKHWTAQLQHYQPSLVIINYGTNESGFSDFVDTTWGGELRRVIRRLRAALPGTSILLMSPMDRGDKDSGGNIVTLAALPRLVAMERQIAVEEHVAFFNTFEAMGGVGTMARWYASEPRLVGSDFIHPMPAGARIVGELLFSAIHKGYDDYRGAPEGAPLTTATPSTGAPERGNMQGAPINSERVTERAPGKGLDKGIDKAEPVGLQQSPAANTDDSGKKESKPPSADSTKTEENVP